MISIELHGVTVACNIASSELAGNLIKSMAKRAQLCPDNYTIVYIS